MAFKFETLDIWKLGAKFADDVYEITKKFPGDEKFGMASQVRRSVSSVPANIAEGSGGTSVKDFQNFLDIATKSIYETVSHLSLAGKRGYISESEYKDLRDRAEILVKKIKAFKNWLDEKGKF